MFRHSCYVAAALVLGQLQAGAVEELLAPVPVNQPQSVLVQPAPAPAPPAHTHSAPPVHSHPHVSMHGHVHHGICCKQPRVHYINHPIMAMLMHKCKTGQAAKIVLEVPTGCCPAEVPVCVPLCCTQAMPKLTKLRGLFGRCVFEFCWPCGTKIRIVQRRDGDLVVHSYEL